MKVIGEGSWKRLPMQIVILGFLKIVFRDYSEKCISVIFTEDYNSVIFTEDCNSVIFTEDYNSVIFTEDCNSVIFTEIAILQFLLKIVIP